MWTAPDLRSQMLTEPVFSPTTSRLSDEKTRIFGPPQLSELIGSSGFSVVVSNSRMVAPSSLDAWPTASFFPLGEIASEPIEKSSGKVSRSLFAGGNVLKDDCPTGPDCER